MPRVGFEPTIPEFQCTKAARTTWPLGSAVGITRTRYSLHYGWSSEWFGCKAAAAGVYMEVAYNSLRSCRGAWSILWGGAPSGWSTSEGRHPLCTCVSVAIYRYNSFAIIICHWCVSLWGRLGALSQGKWIILIPHPSQLHRGKDCFDTSRHNYVKLLTITSLGSTPFCITKKYIN